MKLKLSILLLLLALSSCKESSNNKNLNSTEENKLLIETPEVKVTPINKVNSEMAFNLTPEELKIKFAENSEKTILYCVILDWNLNNKITSIVSFNSGELSATIENQDIHFVPNPQPLNDLSTALIKTADKSMSKISSKTETRKNVEPNYFNVYFLTNKGKFIASKRINEVKNDKDFHDLYEQGSKIIYQIFKNSASIE
jgi:hypothetical protein